MASLCALFLNTGSNILWSPPVLNVGSDYLLTNALYMSKHSSWCAGAWQRCSYLKTNVQMSLVEVSWGEAWKQAIHLFVSVGFDPLWNREICSTDHYHIVLAVAATAGGGSCPHRLGLGSTSSALTEFSQRQPATSDSPPQKPCVVNCNAGFVSEVSEAIALVNLDLRRVFSPSEIPARESLG